MVKAFALFNRIYCTWFFVTGIQSLTKWSAHEFVCSKNARRVVPVEYLFRFFSDWLSYSTFPISLTFLSFLSSCSQHSPRFLSFIRKELVNPDVEVLISVILGVSKCNHIRIVQTHTRHHWYWLDMHTGIECSWDLSWFAGKFCFLCFGIFGDTLLD